MTAGALILVLILIVELRAVGMAIRPAGYSQTDQRNPRSESESQGNLNALGQQQWVHGEIEILSEASV